MKQEYIVIPKQNEWLQDLIGKSFNQKMINKVGKELYIKHAKETGLPGLEKCIVTVNNKYGEILGIGGSSILENVKTGKRFADLTLDQWGQWWARLITPPTNTVQQVNLNRINNTTNTFVMYNQNGVGNVFNHSTSAGTSDKGITAQVGSGTTAPTRGDFNIETAFGNAPESTIQDLSTGVYNSGLGQITSNVAIGPAGGAGTVNEAVMIAHWNADNAFNQFLALFRDAISPGVPFIATNTITLSYLFGL